MKFKLMFGGVNGKNVVAFYFIGRNLTDFWVHFKKTTV